MSSDADHVWQPISTAPRDGKPFDARDENGVEHFNICYFSDGIGEWPSRVPGRAVLTHWRPVPKQRAADQRDRQRIHVSGREGALFDAIHWLRTRLSGLKLEDWDRHVPLGDLFSERTDIPRRLGWGEGSTCYNSALILGASKIRVGSHCWIGPNTVLDGSAGLTIGDWVTICASAQIYTHDNVRQAVTMGEAERDVGPPVIIGSCSRLRNQSRQHPISTRRSMDRMPQNKNVGMRCQGLCQTNTKWLGVFR